MIVQNKFDFYLFGRDILILNVISIFKYFSLISINLIS